MISLPRTLGLRNLIWLTTGSVIGSGIFLVPGVVLRQADGFIVPALLVWSSAASSRYSVRSPTANSAR